MPTEQPPIEVDARVAALAARSYDHTVTWDIQQRVVWSGKARVECTRSLDGGWQISLGALDDPRKTVAITFALDDGAQSEVNLLHDLDLDLDHWWPTRKGGDSVTIRVNDTPASTTVRIDASGKWALQAQHIEGTLTCSNVIYLEG